MMQFIKATIVLFHTLYCSTTLEVWSTRSASNNVVPQVTPQMFCASNWPYYHLLWPCLMQFSHYSHVSLQSQAHSCHVILLISHYCHSHANNYCTIMNI